MIVLDLPGFMVFSVMRFLLQPVSEAFKRLIRHQRLKTMSCNIARTILASPARLRAAECARLALLGKMAPEQAKMNDV